MKDLIGRLEREITHNKALYYQGTPIISDEEYDRLESQLKKIDPDNPVLKMVGSSVDESVDKIRHQRKMLSLEKTYQPGDVEAFLKKGELLSVFKIDGVSCSLVYQDGHLVIAKTRGDGSIGENITAKAIFIPEIPKHVASKESFEIRGEIFCTSTGFHKITKDMLELGLERPTNPRNIVAGVVGRKESIMLARHFSFRAFDIIRDVETCKTEAEKLSAISHMGLPVIESEVHTEMGSVVDRIEEARSFMQEGDYQIDGLVFVLNDLRQHEELGETSHHPRYKLAFKFQGDTKKVKIEAISWQVSRNGVLTPVANIEATELSGANITRVTLHNMGVVADYNLKPGDEIEIVRSGEVIPKFLSVAHTTPGEASIPKNCPCCGSILGREEIWLICNNEKCPDRKIEEILHWIRQSKIEDLSDKRLREMMAQGLVTEIPDLYRVTTDELLSLDKVKDKLAEKIFGNIQKTKKMDLVTFLSALGIDGVSTTKARKIIAHGHNTLDKLVELNAETLASIDGFAEKSANDIVQSIHSKKSLIGGLKKCGVVILAPLAIKNGPLTGKKICITGTMSVPRGELEKIIQSRGGIVVASVSKNTDFLLTNDTSPQSSKYKKAQEIGTQVISEEEFIKLAGD